MICSIFIATAISVSPDTIKCRFSILLAGSTVKLSTVPVIDVILELTHISILFALLSVIFPVTLFAQSVINFHQFTVMFPDTTAALKRFKTQSSSTKIFLLESSLLSIVISYSPVIIKSQSEFTVHSPPPGPASMSPISPPQSQPGIFSIPVLS